MILKSKQTKREEIVVKRVAKLIEKLQKGEIDAKELNYALEEILFEIRTGKIQDDIMKYTKQRKYNKELSELPDLKNYLTEMEELCSMVSGTIRSRQIVSLAISTWFLLNKDE